MMSYMKKDRNVDYLAFLLSKLNLRFPNAELSKVTGYNKSNVSSFLNGKKPTPDNFIDKIIEEFELNRDEIEEEYSQHNVISTKNGLSFIENEDGTYLVTVEVLPIDVKMKYLEDGVQDFGEWEKVTFKVDKIGRGNYKGFKHIGYSMFNPDNPGYYDLQDGDISLCRELGKQHWKDGFNPKNAKRGWVILTERGGVHKDIVKYDLEKGVILCRSRNPSPEYPEFEIPINEVYYIYKVITVNQNSKN